jgi:hypothetical protein
MKADIQNLLLRQMNLNDRFAPGSGHSGNIAVNDRL